MDTKITPKRSRNFFSVIDAFGKINSGIFNGNLAAYGNYEECLDISTEKMNWTLDINGHQLPIYEVPAFKGQYLLVTLLPNLPGNFKENSVNLRHHGDYNLGLDDSVTSDFLYVSSIKKIDHFKGVVQKSDFCVCQTLKLIFLPSSPIIIGITFSFSSYHF